MAFIPAAAAAGIKVQLTEAAASGAVCLDGTPGAYYIERGTGDGVNKWPLECLEFIDPIGVAVIHEGRSLCEPLILC